MMVALNDSDPSGLSVQLTVQLDNRTAVVMSAIVFILVTYYFCETSLLPPSRTVGHTPWRILLHSAWFPSASCAC